MKCGSFHAFVQLRDLRTFTCVTTMLLDCSETLREKVSEKE